MEKAYHALVPDAIFFGAAADIPQIAEQEGVEVVVDLREESTGCAASDAHLQWIKIGLGDHAETPEIEGFRAAIAAVVAAYRAGQKVAFHCGGGRGRTGAVATGVLLALGQCRTVAEAEAMAQAIRPQISLKPNQRAALLALYPAMS